MMPAQLFPSGSDCVNQLLAVPFTIAMRSFVPGVYLGHVGAPVALGTLVLTKFAHDLGVPAYLSLSDVFGFDDELLEMLPQPVISLILLFPSSKKKKFQQSSQPPNEGFFLRQIKALDDACGTIALIHSIANNQDKIQLEKGPLKEYLEAGKTLTPQQRGEALAANDELHHFHNQFVVQGQTEVPEEGVSSGHHFVCFTQVGSEVYEFDGCKPEPVVHGQASPNFVKAAIEAIKTHYMNDPAVLDYSIIAFGGSS